MPSLAKKRTATVRAASEKRSKSPASRSGNAAAKEKKAANPASDEVALVDLITMAEQAVGSLQTVFNALDASILREFAAIAGSIAQTREDIGQLQPDELSREQIPEAGRELAAIVEATEDATHNIMGSAERILEADKSSIEAYSEAVESEVMQIFEACTFQDITGQRVTRVVDTLQDIEDRVNLLANAIGAHHVRASDDTPRRRSSDKDPLLNGPAPAGQGVAQADIDAMFS